VGTADQVWHYCALNICDHWLAQVDIPRFKDPLGLDIKAINESCH